MLANFRTLSFLKKRIHTKFHSPLAHSRLSISPRMASNSLPDSPQPFPAGAQVASVSAEGNRKEYSGLISPGLLANVLCDKVVELMQCFSRHGYSTKLVGGAVRDLILGQTPHDLDLCTEATPEEMLHFLELENYRTVPTGLKHGTVTVVLDTQNVEVTTLRVDKVTDGRHAEVAFTKQWELDAERRDFTVNALYLDCSGAVVDYFDGVGDLRARRIRFVKDPNRRIQEDYLRIFRYFRFYGRINEGRDSHDPRTLDAIRENAEGLRRISIERVWSEVQRILSGNQAPQLVQLMYQLGVAQRVDMPHPGNLEEFGRVWGVHASGKYKLKPVTLLMSLLEGGNEHSVGDYCSRWRMSTVEKKLAITIVTHRSIETENFVKHCKDLFLDKVPIDTVTNLMVYRHTPEQVIGDFLDWKCPKFPITGDDLKTIGLSGRKLGSVKNHIFSIWKESNYLRNKEELIEIAIDLMKD